MQVKFYESVEDNLLQFAVIISKSNGKWVFCKHKERNTYEVPGGRRKKNETILACAKRELYEETGAVEFDITPICVYSVIGKTRVNESGEESFGMLYFADIKQFETELHSEIECIELFDELPKAWTYPLIQPLLIEEYMRRMNPIHLYVPKYEDLWFRQMFMADEETMSYNYNWGGTIPFPKEEWKAWYNHWIVNPEGKRFYRYLMDTTTDAFVGEVAYHYDDARSLTIADIIIYAKYRGKGLGKIGLQMLCEEAKKHGVKVLYDDIAIDNSAVKLFLDYGFIEEYRTQEYIMLKKELGISCG